MGSVCDKEEGTSIEVRERSEGVDIKNKIAEERHKNQKEKNESGRRQETGQCQNGKVRYQSQEKNDVPTEEHRDDKEKNDATEGRRKYGATMSGQKKVQEDM